MSGCARRANRRPFALLAACAFALFLVLAFPARSAAAPTMAALGDSLTRAWGSAGSAADNVAASWSTGTNAAVQSHYSRLLPQKPGLSALNLAKSGSKMAATMTQADGAVAAAAEYVTVLSGTNDACTSTVASMTAVSTFSAKIRATLTELSGIQGTKILVASIPDWYGLWIDFKDDPSATSIWASRGTCPTILGETTSDADRQAVRNRITRYNETLASVCAGFPACTYDGGALHALRFAASDLAFDFFHFSVSGQTRLASVLWNAGPFSPPPPPPPVTNLAPNPDFEQSPLTAYGTSGSATFSWATDEARSPTHSVKIVSGTTAMTRWLTKKTAIRAQAGETYEAGAWVRTSSVAGSARLMLTFWNASGTYLGVTAQSAAVTGTKGWTELGLTKVAPANTAYVRIELRQKSTGTSWWDDVSLVTP